MPEPKHTSKGKSDVHEAAVTLGSAGGKVGGPARARKLSKAELHASAVKAGQARGRQHGHTGQKGQSTVTAHAKKAAEYNEPLHPRAPLTVSTEAASPSSALPGARTPHWSTRRPPGQRRPTARPPRGSRTSSGTWGPPGHGTAPGCPRSRWGTSDRPTARRPGRWVGGPGCPYS